MPSSATPPAPPYTRFTVPVAAHNKWGPPFPSEFLFEGLGADKLMPWARKNDDSGQRDFRPEGNLMQFLKAGDVMRCEVEGLGAIEAVCEAP